MSILRHITPLSEDWKPVVARDLVNVCKDPETPTELKDVLRGELMEIKEELERVIISNESEEW